jgi:hypothetical protein
MAIDVFVSDEHVAIHLSGIDSVVALKSRLILATSDVVSASVQPRDEALARLSWRLGGTHLPGIVTAGRYAVRDASGERVEGDRAFVSVSKDDEVLVIETTLADPRLVILQHQDAHELAWLIGERVDR